MKSKLFLEAAEIIDSDVKTKFSCNAIGYANGGGIEYVMCDEITFYQNLFGLNSTDTFLRLWRESSGFSECCREIHVELFEIRILALLFAREVMKSEKKSFDKSKFGKKFKKEIDISNK